MIKCTRWAELSESVLFLAELSDSVGAITEFRLLNGADPIIVGLEEEDSRSTDSNLSFLREVMRESPAGPTPLCAHVRAIVANIEVSTHFQLFVTLDEPLLVCNYDRALHRS